MMLIAEYIFSKGLKGKKLLSCSLIRCFRLSQYIIYYTVSCMQTFSEIDKKKLQQKQEIK